MERTSIYPGRDTVFKKELKRLEDCKISLRNKELIKLFQNYLFSQNSHDLRVSKVSSQLRRICIDLKLNLDSVNKLDIQNIIALYNRKEEYSAATQADYRRVIKQFYKWFEEEDKRLNAANEKTRSGALQLYKYINKEIKTTYKKKRIDPKEIITDEEIDRVISNGCKHIRDMALIKFLHESGVRVGELLNMCIGDIDFRDTYANVTVDGKTGQRTIPIVNSVPYIVQYLNVHPLKNDPKTSLWLGLSTNQPNKRLMHMSCQKIIYRAFEKAELKTKKMNLHWFRHSRATLLSSQLPESMLCSYMGWSIGSKQVKNYVHLSEKQLEAKFLQIKGINQAVIEEERKPQICVCGTTNDTISKYCYKCGKPLNIKTILEDKPSYDNELNKSVKLLMEIAKDPELMKKFENFLIKQS